MPEVQPEEFKAPSFELKQPGVIQQRSNTKEDKTWATIVSKEKTKEFQATHESTSHRYLPKNIVQLVDMENHKECIETKFVIPLAIRIKTKKNTRATVRGSRVVVAILNAMKKVFNETKIGTINDTQEKNLYIYQHKYQLMIIY
jgi:hypothetical protein